MGTIFAKEFRRTRFSLFIWSVVAGVVIFFGIMEYPALQQITGAAGLGAMKQAIEAIPVAGQLAFGVFNVDLGSPIGYYVVMYYWAGLIVFVHAMYTGASIIAKESRDNTAEYLFTKPYKRTAIVGAKTFAALVNILVIGIVVFVLSLLSMLQITRDAFVFEQILVTGLGMFLTQCVLMALGLLCSAVFKTYKGGMFAAMALLVVCYCLMFTAQYSSAYYFLSPLAYFEIARTAVNGLDGWYVLLSAAVIAICLFFILRLYKRKVMII